MNVTNPVGRIREPLRGVVAEKFFDLRADESPFGFESKLGDVGYCRQLLNQILIKSFGFVARPLVRRTLTDVDGNTDGSRRSSVGRFNRGPVRLERQTDISEFGKA